MARTKEKQLVYVLFYVFVRHLFYQIKTQKDTHTGRVSLSKLTLKKKKRLIRQVEVHDKKNNEIFKKKAPNLFGRYTYHLRLLYTRILLHCTLYPSVRQLSMRLTNRRKCWSSVTKPSYISSS